MNEKVTIHNLVESLVKRHSISEADAEAFVKLFFNLIKDGLLKDSYVEIDPLGTFKLVQSEKENNLEKSDGKESQKICSHVCYIPEAALQELVNKPFSHFKAVVLNENIHFADIDETISTQKDGNEKVEEIANNPDFSSITNATAESLPNASENIGQFSEEGSNSQPEILEELKTPENELRTNNEKSRKQVYIPAIPWCVISTILLVGVLIGASAVWVLMSGRKYIPDVVISAMQEAAISRKDSCIATAEVNRKNFAVSTGKEVETMVDSLSSKRQNDEKNVLMQKEWTEILSDSIEYTIYKTKTTYTIQYGESLAKIAQKFYGNRKLWFYLLKYNKDRIKNPDNIPVGLIIQIPELIPVQGKK